VRGLLAGLRRAEARTASLSRAHRVNLALYTLVLIGLGLIAVEARDTNGPPREVRSLPRPASTAPGQHPVVEPGDRRPVAGAVGVLPPSAGHGSTDAVGTPEAGSEVGSGAAGAVGAGARTSITSDGQGGVVSGGLGSAATAPVPFGVPAAPFASAERPTFSRDLSVVPLPPPLPALPPPASAGAGTDLRGPVIAEPVLAGPAAPRLAGPTFSGTP
jgi:hypothetical protein